MVKKVLSSDRLPKPVGPYSQAIQAGDLIFLSGQIAINPATGVVEETDVRGQTKRIIENTKPSLNQSG
jgi:2-iminobutanoate/2-iminopropanoate deaminase